MSKFESCTKNVYAAVAAGGGGEVGNLPIFIQFHKISEICSFIVFKQIAALSP